MADSALSKGEQKRQAKQALKEKEKAEKDAAKRAAAAAAPPKAAGAAAPTLEEDEDIDPTKYFENRLAWVSDRKENGPDPYPHKFSVQLQLPAFHAKYNDVIEDGGFAPETDVSIAGRVGNIRSGGKGLVFYDLFGEGQKVQIFANAQKFTEFAGMEKDQAIVAFMKLANTIKRGDIVGVVGQPGKTKRGELSIFPTSLQLLTPCLHMMPKTTYGAP